MSVQMYVLRHVHINSPPREVFASRKTAETVAGSDHTVEAVPCLQIDAEPTRVMLLDDPTRVLPVVRRITRQRRQNYGL